MSQTDGKNKIFKVIRIIILSVLIFIAAAVLISFAIHKILSEKELEMLSAAGYVNPVSAGEYDLNVCIYGNDNGTHTIVGISGMGVDDYSAALRQVTDRLADENKIVIPDRAGYGLSDDTTEEQTLERVVEDYRTALKNAGCEAPYVLLPHSLGGIYASYWESLYPEEIEGIVFLDSTELNGADVTFDDITVGAGDLLTAAACKVGLQRLYYKLRIDIIPWLGADDDTYEYSKALCMKNTYSFAKYSETELVNKNCLDAWNSIVTNDIPKIYISATQRTGDELIEWFEYTNRILTESGYDPWVDMTDTEMLDKIIDDQVSSYDEFIETTLMPYINKLGNCELVHIPGDHLIYRHKPDEVYDLLCDFIGTL